MARYCGLSQGCGQLTSQFFCLMSDCPATLSWYSWQFWSLLLLAETQSVESLLTLDLVISGIR